ncbi:MAG: hypothetical protein PHQ60_05765 [Sideroxydans sp.]|nr:hypothetical protein [Sideroxydans sp.]
MRQIIFLLGLLLAGNASAWMMDAEGFGDTPEKAKLAAYATLAGQIRSEIKSVTSASTSVVNKQVDSNFSLTSSQKSDLLLKGVEYGEVGKTQDGYKVVARFDADALHQTLAYYETQTAFDPFGISVRTAKEIKASLLMWQSLMLLGVADQDSEKFRQELDTRLELVNARLEKGLLQVHSNAPDTELQIDGQPLQLDQAIILRAGNHQLSLAAPDYKPLTKVLYVSRGSAQSLSEYLIPLSNEGQRIALNIGDELAGFVPQAELKTAMNEMGWTLSATSPLHLDIDGSSNVRQSGAFSQYDFDFNIGMYDGENKLKSVSFKKTITVSSSYKKRQLANKIMPEIRKAILLLANNVEWPAQNN